MAVAWGTWGTQASPTTYNYTVPSGSDRIGILYYTFETNATLPTSVAATIGGQAMTAFSVGPVQFLNAGVYQCVYGFYILDADLPATGSRAVLVTVTGGSGRTGDAQAFNIATGAEQAEPTLYKNSGNVASFVLPSTGTAAIPAGGAACVGCVGNAANTFTFAGTTASWTERWDGNGLSGDATFGGADTTSGSAINDTLTVTLSATNRTGGILAVLDIPAVAPVITSQPSAATVRVNGDTTATATFTVAATSSGGGLTYDWELETSVGGGSYANLADGNGATWTGQTSASAVGTFTAKTLSGRRVRCNVTDSNGTTTTDAVVLTVLDGPVLSAASATSNGSGVASVTMTSDDALTANGEILLVTASINGEVIARTTVRPA